MMSLLKRFINFLLAKIGLELRFAQTLERHIRLGRYRWLQDRGLRSVIDVGANVGQFAVQIRTILPDVTIVSFEPIASCFDELVVKTRGLEPIRCYPFALGEMDSQMPFHRNEYSPSSSLLTMTKEHIDAFPFTERTVEEMITVRTLDGMEQELALKAPILLKIDVQGYEMNVLRGAERLLSSVDVIILEVSFVRLYEGQPLFNDIDRYLRERDFEFHGNFDQMLDPKTGLCMQADAIYIRRKSDTVS